MVIPGLVAASLIGGGAGILGGILGKPKTPNPYQVANAQSGQNRQDMLTAAGLNQFGQVGPYGSQTWSGDLGSPDRTLTTTLDPRLEALQYGQVGAAQGALGNIPQGAFSLSGLPQVNPNFNMGGDLVRGLQQISGPGRDARDAINQRYTQAAAAFGRPESEFVGSDGYRAFQNELNDYYSQSTDSAELQEQLAFHQGRVDDPLHGASAQQFIQTIQGRLPQVQNKHFGSVLPITTDFDRAPGIQRELDMSGVTPLAGTGDFSGDRSKIEDALYQRATSRLDPRFAQDESALQSRLANQGITQGSEAYGNELANFGRTKNDAYSSAMNDAILAGGGEQSRLFGLSLAARDQTFGEAATKGGFVNQAQGQQYGQNMGGAQFQNDAQQQAWLQALSEAQFANQTTMQDYSRNLGQQQFGLQARGQLAGEQFGVRNQPFNEFSLLNGQTGSMQPNFGQPAQYSPMQTDLTGNIYGSAGMNNAYNAQMGAGLFGLGGNIANSYMLSQMLKPT